MKRQITRLSIWGTVAFMITISLQAQESDLAVARKTQSAVNYSVATAVTNSLSIPELKSTHPQMLDNFTKYFPSATDISWYRLNDCYQVSFLLAGKKARAVFTGQDELSYSIVLYKSQDLSAQLKSLLASNYSGYSIFSAQEVKARQGSCYHLVMENASGFVNLKVAGDDIEEVSRTVKSK